MKTKQKKVPAVVLLWGKEGEEEKGEGGKTFEVSNIFTLFNFFFLQNNPRFLKKCVGDIKVWNISMFLIYQLLIH